MFNAEICFFSPLCIKTVHEGHHPALLLQFILTELFNLNEACKKGDSFAFIIANSPYFFPYDWSHKIGYLVKMREHAHLLPHAFPQLTKEVSYFNKSFKAILHKVEKVKTDKKPWPQKQIRESLKNIYSSLEPFLIACNKDENLLLFLLKNKQNLTELFSPENFKILLKKIALDYEAMIDLTLQEYQNRGFNLIISEDESSKE